VGFEPTIPVLERAKAVRALDRDRILSKSCHCWPLYTVDAAQVVQRQNTSVHCGSRFKNVAYKAGVRLVIAVLGTCPIRLHCAFRHVAVRCSPVPQRVAGLKRVSNTEPRTIQEVSSGSQLKDTAVTRNAYRILAS
jgi:hypothetical protein